MNILIVDDISINRKLLRVTLEAEGYTTLEAADGIEAMQILAHQKVDAVVSDILMPNMDGFRLCTEIRRSEVHRDLPFIVYTSTFTSADDITLAHSVGADKYLAKPASAETLLAALQEVMDNKTAHQPAALVNEQLVLKQYSAALVHKLEKRNDQLNESLSAMRRAQRRIRELNSDLERRVQERTSELKTANRYLSNRTEEIQRFYHSLAHELKTPVTSAREFVSLLEEGAAGPVTETQRELLVLVKEGCDQMTRCLDDLLDAARLDTAKLSLKLETASLPKLAHRVLKSIRPAIVAKGVVLETSFDESVPDISCDEHRLMQVITNLVNNALKFTPEGGRISIQIGRSTTHSDSVQVTVADTGRGIPSDQVDRIFDRFYQVKAADAQTGNGMGLGLFICREIVRLHGGAIGVESQLGQGSRFSVHLPINCVGSPKTSSRPSYCLPLVYQQTVSKESV